ncbi:MAG TPA: MFS transporter [Actinomycetes bacterium]
MTDGLRDWSTRTFASLDNPNYRRFFIGQVVSLVGTWMQSVAQAWLVLQLTHSATWLGLAVALQFLPILLLGPYGGVVVDRVDKRRLLIGTQLAAAVQALVLGLLTVNGHVTIAWVLALSLGLGLVNVLDNPARQAFVREMVDGDQVRNAVSLNSVLVNVARAVGPAVAGVLIASVGVGACFLVNAVSFGAVIVAYLTMHRSQLAQSAPVRRAPGQLREGLRYVRRAPQLLVPLLMMALVGTLTYEFQVVLPALVTHTFGGDARDYGLITAAMGVGAVIGGLVSAGRSVTGIAPMVASAFVFGVTDLLTALTPTLLLAAVSLVAVGAASVWFLSTGNATLQLNSAPAMRGRVMALWAVAFLGSTPVGGPIVGWIAQHAGPRWALGVGAAAALVAAAMGALVLRRRPAVDVVVPQGDGT